MSARRAVKSALKNKGPDAEPVDRADVDRLKRHLGERGPVWWEDGSPDSNRTMFKNTSYRDWRMAKEKGVLQESLSTCDGMYGAEPIRDSPARLIDHWCHMLVRAIAASVLAIGGPATRSQLLVKPISSSTLATLIPIEES